MNWIDAELAEFGRRIGLPGLAVDAAGSCQLQIESGDVIAIELVGDDVIVYRRHALPWPDPGMLLRALARCNLREGGTPLQIGLRGQAAEASLVVAMRLPQRAFTAQRLEAGWDTIRRWIEDCKESAGTR